MSGTTNTVPSWPEPLDAAAFHGPLGEVVKRIEPHTEADEAALLGQALIGVGNVIGPTPYFAVEAERHRMNLFGVIVGKSSKARKGTSWGYVKRLVEPADEMWTGRIANGLASGEGLVAAVADNADGWDRRLMVIEPELGKVLAVMARKENTLSAVIREAWDSGNLRVMTKNNAVSATGAHISIVGHVTEDELRDRLTTTDTSNGFANRFLWFCAKRSKLLPEGGAPLGEAEWSAIQRPVKDAVAYARSNVTELKRDAAARELWISVYPQLSDERQGLYGVVTSRAEAQVMRLACVYALMDQSTEIRVEHLQAALAVWHYCDESARFIFGRKASDSIRQRIVESLRANPNGVTKTTIRDLFNRNETNERIEGTLEQMELDGEITRHTKIGGQGRRAEHFTPTTKLLQSTPRDNGADQLSAAA
jgi:hypothetical protein